jgi:hypothetical protein
MSAVDYIVSNNDKYPQLPKSWQELYRVMDDYADHLEATAWVTDGSLPPVDPEVPETSLWVNILCNGGVVLCDYYSFENNCWHFDSTVIAWRLLPTAPQ